MKNIPANHDAHVKTRVQDLPIIGTVTLPVHVMRTKDGKFHSGFAFMKFQDHQVDICTDDEVELGRLGGTIGGHTEISMNDLKKAAELAEGGHDLPPADKLILDTAEMWQAVAQLFDSPEGQAKLKEISEQGAKKREAEELARLEREIAKLEAEEEELAKEDDA